MIPQTLPDGAQIEVVFTDNSGTDYTLTADIKGTEWPIGKTVIYKISRSSINWTYELSVSMPGTSPIAAVHNNTVSQATSITPVGISNPPNGRHSFRSTADHGQIPHPLG